MPYMIYSCYGYNCLRRSFLCLMKLDLPGTLLLAMRITHELVYEAMSYTICCLIITRSLIMGCPPWFLPPCYCNIRKMFVQLTFHYTYLRAENFATFQIILMGWQCTNIWQFYVISLSAFLVVFIEYEMPVWVTWLVLPISILSMLSKFNEVIPSN